MAQGEKAPDVKVSEARLISGSHLHPGDRLRRPFVFNRPLVPLIAPFHLSKYPTIGAMAQQRTFSAAAMASTMLMMAVLPGAFAALPSSSPIVVSKAVLSCCLMQVR